VKNLLAAILLTGFLVVALPTGVTAAESMEPRSRITAGLFGRLTMFDTDLPADLALGLGGRLGWMFAPRWGLELDASGNGDLDDDAKVTFVPIHLRLMREWPAGPDSRFHLAAGYVHSEYSIEEVGATESHDASDDGVSFMAGFERDLSRSLAFRMDAVVDDNLGGDAGGGQGDDWHFGLEFGLAFGHHPGEAPDGDEDMDGVPDSRDRCPGTPHGTAVDSDGCPKLFEEGQTDVILEGVNFEIDQATLLSGSKAVLDGVADVLKIHSDIRVEVQGHTDNTGTAEHNQELSEARARAVRDYLIGRGVAADRLEARGYGQDRPIESNDTEAGRAHNRRVELKKLD
jgi:outer membrane protein OmpA-like peptidoglycan-associated protein